MNEPHFDRPPDRPDPRREAYTGKPVERDSEAARDSEERFHTAFEASPIGFAIVELDGRLRAVNRSFCEMLGYTTEELQARSFYELTYPDDKPASAAVQTRLLRGEIDSFQLEKRYFHKRGHLVWAELTASLVRDAARAPAYFVSQIVDITARKQAEDALAELERSNAELEEFAYVASHDLQRPLRTVASYAQLLAERYEHELDDRADRWIGYIVGGVTRMRQLIDDLLRLARVGTAEMDFAPTDTGAIATRCWEALRTQSGAEDLGLTVGELPTIDADPSQIEQLFQNIFSNAIKYRRTGVPLRVDARAERYPESGGAAWEFTIADNGIGLDMSQSERIFQAFQRLHREDAYEGTGIGLAICKRVVQRHGGRIWVVSAPGAGAAFHFTLRELAS